MTIKTLRMIDEHCDRYSDWLIELMDRFGVNNTQDIPEEEALKYLKELEDAHKDNDWK